MYSTEYSEYSEYVCSTEYKEYIEYINCQKSIVFLYSVEYKMVPVTAP